jgi:hypothetical protein
MPTQPRVHLFESKDNRDEDSLAREPHLPQVWQFGARARYHLQRHNPSNLRKLCRDIINETCSVRNAAMNPSGVPTFR